jgi:AhpD family alkylhydroperoxidase
MFIPRQLDDLYNRFSDAAYEAGALNRKTKELIALACSVMADCVPCVRYHYAEALKNDASGAEIMEVMSITMSVAAGSKRAKYGPLVTELNSDAQENAKS